MQPIPYATQSIDDDDLAAVRDALTSGWLTQGPAGPAFEAAFKRGADALHQQMDTVEKTLGAP